MPRLRDMCLSLSVLCATPLLAGTARADSTVTLKLIEANGPGTADDVDVTGASVLRIGTGYRLEIKVDRAAGSWSGSSLVFDETLAEGKQISAPTAFGITDIVAHYGQAPTGSSYTPIVGPALITTPSIVQRVQPKWTLGVLDTGSGQTEQLEFGFALDSASCRDGTPIDIAARLTGFLDGVAIQATASLPQKLARGDLAGLISMKSIGIANYQHPALGPGVLIRYQVGINNMGPVAFRAPDGSTPAIEMIFESGAHLYPFRLSSSDLVNAPVFSNDPLDPGPTWPGLDEVDLDGDGAYSAPYEEDFTLPAGLQFSRTRSFQPLPVLLGTTANTVDGIQPIVSNGRVSDTGVLDVFATCEDIDFANRALRDLQVRIHAVVRDVTFGGATRSLALGSAADPVGYNLNNELSVDDCTPSAWSYVRKWPDWNDASGLWSGGKLIGVGADASFEFQFAPPLGAGEVDSAAIVDRLPVGARYRAHIPDHLGTANNSRACTGTEPTPCGGYGACIDGQCEGIYGLRVYYCETPSDFGHPAFAALRSSGDCLPAVRGTAPGETDLWVPPSGITTPTHLVLWSADMAPRPWGDDGLDAVKATIRLEVTSASPGVMENTAWFSGQYDVGLGVTEIASAPFGTEPEGPVPATTLDAETSNLFEDDAWYRVADYQCVQMRKWHQSANTLGPNQCGRIVFAMQVRDQYPLAANPVFELEVPDGVYLDDPLNDLASTNPHFQNSISYNGVITGGDAPICPPGGTVTEPYTDDNPFAWVYAGGCGLARGTIGWSLYDVYFCTEADYPFVHGQVIEFSARMVSMDNGPDAPGELCPPTFGGPDDGDGIAEPNESGNPRYPITMVVQPSQRPSVVAGCDPAGLAFTVGADNPSGRALADVVARFDVPASTSFVGVSDVEPATGVVIEVSAGPLPGTWLPVGDIPDGDVRHVRLRGELVGLELEPFVGHAGFVVHLATTATSGTPIVGTMTMLSDYAESSVAATPFVIGSCQRLTVRKYFDGNSNQTQDADEPALSDWSFTVMDVLGAAVGSGVTGAEGTWEVLLPSGSYTVHEDAAAASADYSWSLTTPQDVPVTFIVGGLGATVAFGNTCQCGTDVCQPLACSPLGGQLAACGEDAPLDCDDDEMCTTDSCDPSDLDGDACVHEPVDCGGESGGLFVPVADAAGEVVGAIRCALVGGAISCDTGADADGDGRPDLVVYPALGGACDDAP